MQKLRRKEKDEGLVLKGQVYSNDECSVISGTKVIMYGDTTFTNEEGVFKFKIDYSKRVQTQLHFQHNGYKSKTIDLWRYEIYQNQKISLERLEDKDYFEELQIKLRPKNEDEIMLIIQSSCEPKGGMRRFYEEVNNFIIRPKKLEKEGLVIVEFRVNTRGEVDNVKVLKSLNAYCDNQVKESIQLAAVEWRPAKQRGKLISQKFILPVFFKKEE